MTVYMPLLKAKPGEFEAIGELAPGTLSAIRPVFELCPGPDEDKVLDQAIVKATKYLPAGAVVAVDFAQIDPLRTVTSSGLPAMTHVGDAFAAAGILVVPVVRFTDPISVRNLAGSVAASAAAIAAAGAAVGGTRGAFAGGDVVLRFGSEHARPAAMVPRGLLLGLLGDIGVPRPRVHVLVDMFEVGTLADVLAASRTASATITWAQGIGGWSSVTVAAGSFPSAISGLPVGTVTELERHDARLWRRLARVHAGLDYGDYAVAHPAMPSAFGRGPLPNLRYTDGRFFRVWRERRIAPGNESFYDLASSVAGDPSYQGSGYSWGDAQVALSAVRGRGPGTATQWRAYGTNHHLTLVVDRLASLGEP